MKQKKCPINIQVQFTCRCGNEDGNKFIWCNECLNTKYLSLLCLECERKYTLKLTSKENRIILSEEK